MYKYNFWGVIPPNEKLVYNAGSCLCPQQPKYKFNTKFLNSCFSLIHLFIISFNSFAHSVYSG